MYTDLRGLLTWINVNLTALQKLIVVLLLLFNSSFVALAQERSITLRGRVVDANTGEPMANVRVVAQVTDQATITDANGGFTLELPPGPQELYITTVTYGLVKKTINVGAGTNKDALLVILWGFEILIRPPLTVMIEASCSSVS